MYQYGYTYALNTRVIVQKGKIITPSASKRPGVSNLDYKPQNLREYTGELLILLKEWCGFLIEFHLWGKSFRTSRETFCRTKFKDHGYLETLLFNIIFYHMI